MFPISSEMEDEMVFEEFKRSYLRGIIAGDDDDEEGNVSGGDDITPKEKWRRLRVDGRKQLRNHVRNEKSFLFS